MEKNKEGEDTDNVSLSPYHQNNNVSLDSNCTPNSSSIASSIEAETWQIDYPLGVTLATALAYLNFGYSVSIMNSVDVYMVKAAGWCPESFHSSHSWNIASDTIEICPTGVQNLATVNAVLYIGAIIGVLYGTNCSTRRGRRLALLGAYLTFLMGYLILSISSSLSSFITGRLISGVAVGITTVSAPLMVNEIARPVEKGFLGSLSQSFIALGILLCNLLSLPLVSPTATKLVTRTIGMNPDDFKTYWRLILGAPPTIISIIGFISFTHIFTHDTPQWYVDTLQYWEAKNVR